MIDLTLRTEIHEYVLNNWRGHMVIEAVYEQRGHVYVCIVPRARVAFNPPDATLYRWDRKEQNVHGQDVETATLTEVCFLNGVTGTPEWSDDDAEEDHDYPSR